MRTLVLIAIFTMFIISSSFGDVLKKDGVYLVFDNSTLTDTWKKGVDGSWHIDKGVQLGVEGVYTVDPSVRVGASYHLIGDTYDVKYAPRNKGFGGGVVGQEAGLSVNLGDIDNTFLVALNYKIQSWFVDEVNMNYGPEYAVSPLSIVNELSVSISLKLF